MSGDLIGDAEQRSFLELIPYRRIFILSERLSNGSTGSEAFTARESSDRIASEGSQTRVDHRVDIGHRAVKNIRGSLSSR